jgi:predicted transcriptional regulator
MGNAKAEALALIQKMADDATWEQIHYRVYFRAKIEQGLADVAAGRVTTHDEVKAEVDQWLASLGRMPQSTTSTNSSNGSPATP